MKDSTNPEFPEVALELIKVPSLYKSDTAVNTPEKAVDFIATHLKKSAVENITVIMFNTAMTPLCYSVVSKGTTSETSYTPASIIRIALLCNATGVIFIHNHPSGNPEPSRDDDQIAMQISDALGMFRLNLIDFIVVGGEKLYSYCENQRMPFTNSTVS